MKSINWLSSIGQVVLIFIGVTVAIWFENWNNDNQERKREVQLLRQMTIDLGHDLRDVNGNVRSAQRQLASCNLILDNLNSSNTYVDSLGRHFAGLPLYTFFNCNVGAYQTLKGLGLDLVENDTLRQQIVELYEGSYAYLNNNTKIAHDYSMTVLIPTLTRNFKDIHVEIGRLNSTATPVDYALLKKNLEFIQQVRFLASFQQMSIKLNTNIGGLIERLRTNIDSELKRLN